MSVAKNLMFQRKYYPNIYEGYLQFYKEDYDNTINEEEEGKSNNVILIIADEFKEILQKVFVIPNEVAKDKLNIIEEFDEVEIYKSYDEDFKLIVNNSSVKIHCMYLYSFTNQVIRLLKNTNKQSFKETSIVYMMREPSLYEKVYLKESSGKLIMVNSVEELFRNLSTVNLTYNEEILINKLNVDSKKQLGVKSNLGESYYKVSLSLDLIRNIIDMGLMKEEISIINQYIFTFIMDEYRNEGKKIIDSYITKEFVHNYIVVDKFLSEGERLSKAIVEMIRGEIVKELIDFKDFKGTSDLYVNLLGSSIKKLDGVLSHSLNELHKNVNII